MSRLNASKWLVVTLAMLLSTSTYANAWLFGLEAGYMWRSYKLNANTVNASPVVAGATGIPVGAQMGDTIVTLRDDGGLWGGFLGYEYQISPWFVGTVEAKVTIETIVEDHQIQYADKINGMNLFLADVKYERGTQWELSTTIGMKGARDWIPFVRAGAVVGNDELTYPLTLINGGFLIQDSMLQHNRRYGWLVGVGVEAPIFHDSIVPLLRTSTVRLEYNYNRTERFTMDDVNPPFNGRQTARPATHAIKLALVLKHQT